MDKMSKLTQRALAGLAKRPGRHADGQGLFLRVGAKGNINWTYRFRLGGKETELSFGAYPRIGLDEARRLHALARAKVISGVDPRAEKKSVSAARKAALSDKFRTGLMPTKPTFGQIADDYVETHEASWRNPKHRQQWRNTLRDYCRSLHDVPVDEIDTKAVLAVLKPIWTTKPETASRVRGRVETIINAARALGHIDESRANPARWRGHLDQLLPKQPALSRGNHAAMPYADLPAFMARLKEAPGTAAKALAFAVLTAARSGEVLGARWDEVDLDNAVWIIPAQRMKAAKQHRVPLSEPALEILREMRAGRKGDHPFVFPGQRPRRPLSNMALEMTMRRLGAGEFTPHGMRSGFRDWCTEAARVDYDVAERCLAHAVGSGAALSYDRSDRLELRRPVMSQWAAFLGGPATGDNVVDLTAWKA
jgi:integrase